MESEVTYAEVKFKNVPPPADPEASSKTRTSLSVFQRIPSWFPWVMAGFFILLSIVLLVGIFVPLKRSLKKTPHKRLPLNSTVWHCLLKSHGETEQKFSCCKEGWQQFQSSCYNFSKERETWNDSRKKCMDMDSDLVVINEGAEQEFLMKQIKYKSGAKNFCIGLTDQEEKDRWQWVDRTPINSTVTFWRENEPSNDDENCVVMHIDRRRYNWGTGMDEGWMKNWNDVKCSEGSHHYICESRAVISAIDPACGF